MLKLLQKQDFFFIVAAYSNGRDPDGPDEQDPTALAAFAALLLEELGPPQAGP